MNGNIEIINLYSKGYSLKKIAKMLAVSDTTIKNRLKKLGIEINSTPQKKSFSGDVEEFKRLFFSTTNNKLLSEKYSVSQSQIHKWATQLGLSREKNLVDVESLKNDYLSGKSFNELSKKYGVSNVTLKKMYVDSGGIIRSHKQTQRITIKKVAKTKLETYGYEYFPPGISYGSKSKNELEIKDFLNSFGFNFETDNSVLEGKHIDLYDDSLKLGIEYSGTWCHHENIDRIDKKYHYNKWKIAKSKGVELITIWDYEYITRREQVKNFLLARCGIFDRRIYARNCVFSESFDKHFDFFDVNHIQGRPHTIERNFILSYDNEIVAVASFSKHHRNGSDIVLNRLAFKAGLQIIGGASKLIKNSLQHFNQRIITWSDNRYSNGGIYEKAGFQKNADLNPDYFYENGPGNIKSKQSMTKKNMKCPPDMTEREYALSLGWNRVWDCGKIRWVYE